MSLMHCSHPTTNIFLSVIVVDQLSLLNSLSHNFQSIITRTSPPSWGSIGELRCLPISSTPLRQCVTNSKIYKEYENSCQIDKSQKPTTVFTCRWALINPFKTQFVVIYHYSTKMILGMNHPNILLGRENVSWAYT